MVLTTVQVLRIRQNKGANSEIVHSAHRDSIVIDNSVSEKSPKSVIMDNGAPDKS